ncbi:DUF2783 domain-containing protein [Aquabacterium sp.]|uniref:DUF2783 domain-containing protein n=1 Tax=Aquabacterium sp. TaxID=1872578 RepID=UPI0037852DEF
MPLLHEPNIADPDGFYESLIEHQRDLDDTQAREFQARLLLILANQVGDRQVLDQALRLARDAGGPRTSSAGLRPAVGPGAQPGR